MTQALPPFLTDPEGCIKYYERNMATTDLGTWRLRLKILSSLGKGYEDTPAYQRLESYIEFHRKRSELLELIGG